MFHLDDGSIGWSGAMTAMTVFVPQAGARPLAQGPGETRQGDDVQADTVIVPLDEYFGLPWRPSNKV